MDMSSICWQPGLNPTQPNPSKHAEQVQCNIIEQFYVGNIQVTRRYSMHINFVTFVLSTAFNRDLLGKNEISYLDPTEPSR